MDGLPLNIRESNTLSVLCKNLIDFFLDKFNANFLLKLFIVTGLPKLCADAKSHNLALST